MLSQQTCAVLYKVHMLSKNKVMNVCPCCHGYKVSLATTDGLDWYCYKVRVNLVSLQISRWCPFEAIAGLKYCQKRVFDAQKDYYIIDEFVVEVGKIFNCYAMTEICLQKYPSLQNFSSSPWFISV